MKTIFKGNHFSIVWNIIDRSTNHPFEFTGMKVEVGLYSDSFNFPLQSYNVNNGTITAVIEANTLPAGVFNIMCRYSTDHEQSYCTYRNAFQISNRPCHASEIVEIESYASHIDPSSEDPDAPDYSKCQLIAEELFKEKFRLPQLTADRAIADEQGNRITDTYVKREAVANHIKQIYNQQFLENPPLITEGYITPEMLSEETKQMLENTGQTITNLPDGEDLQSVHGVLKFADKQYNPNAYSGLGRRILRKNIVAGVNVLTQSMMQWPNTIYVIQYDYDLQGETITVPEGCVLQFEGGGFSNGEVKNYNKFIKASILGLYCNNENKAIENSKLFERYINMGFSIELDGAYYFGANSILKNNVNVKGGEYIIKGDMPILLNGEDIDLNLNNVCFNTREKKHIELINRIFIVELNSIEKRPIRSLSIQNCVIDGCRLFTWYSNLDVESINKIPIDNIHISSNSFINTGINSIKINDASVMTVMIKGNIIKNCGIGTFNISSDNLSGVKKGSLCFIGNHIENENVILDNLESEYSYITPLITEGFNEVFIKNNTFSNIVCFEKNALPYSFYSSDKNLHVSGNTFNNVFNAYNGHPNNVMFKCKGAYNRYLTDNVYIIDKTYLIGKHPNLFKDYDFSKILVNFINIASESDCGNLIVQNNIMCIPGILSCPNVYPSSIVLKGRVLLKNNYIEAQGAEGSLLAFKKYDSSECRGDIVVENNGIGFKIYSR